LGYGIKNGEEVIEMGHAGIACPKEEKRKKLVASKVLLKVTLIFICV